MHPICASCFHIYVLRVESFLGRYLLISVGPLRLCSGASLGRAVGAVLLALTLLKLRVLGGRGLARSCGREFRFSASALRARACAHAGMA